MSTATRFSIVRLGLVFLSYLVVILGCKYGKEMMEQIFNVTLSSMINMTLSRVLDIKFND